MNWKKGMLYALVCVCIMNCTGCTYYAPENSAILQSVQNETSVPNVVTEDTTEMTQPESGENLTEESIEDTIIQDTESHRLLDGISIGLDPGHQRYGNSEQEAIAPGSTETKNKVTGGAVGASTRIPEYITVLEISEMLREKLETEGATVYMTRESHDVDISNQERTQMMNAYGVDLMLRIHCDSAENQSANGCALYVSQSNSIAAQSRLYAETILPAVCDSTGAKNNGIVQNDNYTGQNWAEVPCIMIECGFLSNVEEDVLLNTAAYQELLTDGILNGLIACFNDNREDKPESVKPTETVMNDALTPYLDESGENRSAVADAEQLIVVRSDHANASVYMLESTDGRWVLIREVSGVVGKNGVSKESREGDYRTPQGVFPLGFAFGTQQLEGLSVEYRQTNQNCYWVDDPESELYNQWVESSTITWKSAEHLSEYQNSYKYSVVIEYNMDPVIPYRGSAIFLHCMTGAYTAGCVAIAEAEMLDVLNWLDERKNPMILIY